MTCSAVHNLAKSRGKLKTINVEIVAYHFPPLHAGHGVQSLQLAAALKKVSVKCRFYAANLTGALQKEKMNDIPIIRFRTSSRPRWDYLLYSLKVVRKLWSERHSYDIIQCNSVKPFWFLILLLAKLIRKPVVVIMTLAGSDDPISLKQKSFLWRIEARSMSSYDRLICIASTIRSACLSAHIPHWKLVTIPVGVDFELFQPVSNGNDKIRLRKKLGLPIDHKIVLFVGAVVHRKGCDVLLEAWSKLVVENDRCSLVMIGPYKQGHSSKDAPMFECMDDNHYLQLRRENIVLLGQQDHKAIADYMQTAHIFVLPSRAEGLPNTILEAMACGLPIIASRLPGSTDDIIQDRFNGLFVEPGNPTDLENQLQILLDDEEFCNSLGRNALASVRSSFSINKVAVDTRLLYNQVLSGHKTED